LNTAHGVHVTVAANPASGSDQHIASDHRSRRIGKVISALNATNGAWLARMSGSGATCFAIYENTAETQKIMLDRPGWWVHARVLS
jgi:4-diphosphocytidyl-2-C-methyl-D-erythritol kinase